MYVCIYVCIYIYINQKTQTKQAYTNAKSKNNKQTTDSNKQTGPGGERPARRVVPSKNKRKK